MTETISTRLADALKLRNLDMKGASRKAGLGDTYVRDVLKRGLNPTAAALLRLSEALGVRSEWLLTGEGPTELGGEVRFGEFVDVFEQLTDEQQVAVLNMMQSMIPRDREPK